MLDFLANDLLLALAVILTVGLAIGKIKIGGISLGAAAVLFVAVGLSAANPDILMPALIYQFGLAIFVYTIGLSAGPTFMQTMKSRGFAMNIAAVGVLIVLIGLGMVVILLPGLDRITGAGMFAGALSSTPGMATIVESVPHLLGDGSSPDAGAPAVIGYSLAYPGGILGAILVGAIGAKLLKVDHIADAQKEGVLASPLQYRTFRIDRLPNCDSCTVADLSGLIGADVIATRLVKSQGQQFLLEPTSRLSVGSIIMVNGTDEELDKAVAALGEEVDYTADGTDLEYVRMVVSNPDVIGSRIRDLHTMRDHGFLISRLRRGDQDVVPHPDDVLQPSDRIRVVTSKSNTNNVREFIGDSEKSLASPDLLPFTLGLLLGIALGSIPIPLPGGITVSLGFGGGPIIVGLILGALGRTGPIRWQLPYHSNKTIETLGMAIFMAGVGTKAGGGFRAALQDPTSFMYILMGLVLTVASAVLIIAILMTWRKLTFDESMGVAAGITTNPAIIAYLNAATKTELSARGYTAVYPVMMIGKILASQALIVLLL